jgi:hypothetical protein
VWTKPVGDGRLAVFFINTDNHKAAPSRPRMPRQSTASNINLVP